MANTNIIAGFFLVVLNAFCFTAQANSPFFGATEPTVQKASEISVSSTSGQIYVNGLTGVNTRVSIFNQQWLLVNRTWATTQNLFVPDLEQGQYFVVVETYSGDHATDRQQYDVAIEVKGKQGHDSAQNVTVKPQGDALHVAGLEADSKVRVSVYNNEWLLVGRHFAQQDTMAFSDLQDGRYFVRVEFLSEDLQTVVAVKDCYASVLTNTLTGTK